MVAEVLDAVERRPSGAHLVVLSDFDGTLTPFTVDPAMSSLRLETRQLLEALSARTDVTVGLVSGRRLEDLTQRTGLPDDVYLAGLHGLEIRRGNFAWNHPDLMESRDLIDTVVDEMDRAVGYVDGVRLEHKGVALTVHVRGVSPSSRQAVLDRAKQVAQPWLQSGALKALDANEAFELLPNIPWTKGDAVQWIVEHVQARIGRPVWCVFFGDDVTDEDAFEAMSTNLGVVVGRRPSAARMRLDSPADVAAVLAGVNGPGPRTPARWGGSGGGPPETSP
jgi:trehalose 6-phosphate phosphatase